MGLGIWIFLFGVVIVVAAVLVHIFTTWLSVSWTWVAVGVGFFFIILGAVLYIFQRRKKKVEPELAMQPPPFIYQEPEPQTQQPIVLPQGGQGGQGVSPEVVLLLQQQQQQNLENQQRFNALAKAMDKKDEKEKIRALEAKIDTINKENEATKLKMKEERTLPQIIVPNQGQYTPAEVVRPPSSNKREREKRKDQEDFNNQLKLQALQSGLQFVNPQALQSGVQTGIQLGQFATSPETMKAVSSLGKGFQKFGKVAGEKLPKVTSALTSAVSKIKVK